MTKTAPRLKHRIEYAAFVLLRGFLSLLPARIADELGGMLGGFVGTLLRIRRDVVDENLRLAFPDENDRWRRRVGRASYRHLVREAIATFRMGSTDRETILARTTLHGDFEGLMAAVKAGNGAIIVTGHLGNWEIGGASVAVRGVPVDAVALVQANHLFDREIVETRGPTGNDRHAPRPRAPPGSQINPAGQGPRAGGGPERSKGRGVCRFLRDSRGYRQRSGRVCSPYRSATVSGRFDPKTGPIAELRRASGANSNRGHRRHGRRCGAGHPGTHGGPGSVGPTPSRAVFLAAQAVEDPAGHRNRTSPGAVLM